MLQHGQNHAVTSCCEHGSSLRDAQALSDDARANLNDGSEAESLHVGASSRQCGATNKLARPTTTFRRTLLAPWTRTWGDLSCQYPEAARSCTACRKARRSDRGNALSVGNQGAAPEPAFWRKGATWICWRGWLATDL